MPHSLDAWSTFSRPLAPVEAMRDLQRHGSLGLSRAPTQPRCEVRFRSQHPGASAPYEARERQVLLLGYAYVRRNLPASSSESTL